MGKSMKGKSRTGFAKEMELITIATILCILGSLPAIREKAKGCSSTITSKNMSVLGTVIIRMVLGSTSMRMEVITKGISKMGNAMGRESSTTTISKKWKAYGLMASSLVTVT